MATSSIFISRLEGLPVLDAAGGNIGKIYDVVVQQRIMNRTRVRGFVIELFAKRRTFIPIQRMRHITGLQMTIAGVVDTRVFERRSSEVLVIEDLFDRQIVDGDREGSIYDVSMHEVRHGEWELHEVAIEERRSSGPFHLKSKGSLVVTSWDEVAAQVMYADQSTDKKIAQLNELNAADMARELYDMEPERRAEIANALDDEQLADAVQELPEDEQVEILTSLNLNRAADLLDEMDPDDAADLLHDLPDAYAEQLLNLMEPEEAKDVRNLLQYEESAAGGMMTPEPVILGPDATVARALAKVRHEELTPALASMVFITRPPHDTPSGQYIGAVHVQRLLREPPSLQIGQMIDPSLEPVRPETDLYSLSRYFATYNLVIAPVVTETSQLVGAVTVDDLLDHMLPPDWRGDHLEGTQPEVNDE